jgi:transposase
MLFRDIYKFRGYTYNEIIIKEDVVHIFLRRTRKTATCSNCGKRNPLRGDSYKRTVRDLDLGTKKCFITFFEEKLRCVCGFRGYEYLSFARSYSRCTIRFEEFVYKLCEKMTISDVCDIVQLDWKTVKNIDKYYIKQQIVSLRNITPERIGVDEIAYDKGHKYLTVVRDLELNGVIWVGLNRKKETLDEFFNEIGEQKQALVELVVVDMWDPYIASIREYCPDADIVIDKFHIVKKANEALDNIRKKEFANANEKERLNMKRKRFIILKRNKNLNEKQRERLSELMRNNDTLYKSYLLKEQISDIFDEKDYENALKRLNEWTDNVFESEIEPFKKMIKTLRKYFYGIRNYFKHKVTNAASEGFNTKINIVRRRAYGFWDIDYFILKIFQTCGVMKI